jgi:hypothetical protein
MRILLLFFIVSSVCHGQIRKVQATLSTITRTMQIDLGRGPSSTSNIFNRLDGVTNTKYYLCSSISQNPVTPDVFIQVTAEWPTGHSWSDDNKLIFQTSTNKGATWSGVSDFYSPGASLGVVDGGGGYSSDGRYHYFVDVHAGVEGASAAAPHYVYYLYSDDNGANVTATDITSLIPSDGLATWRFYGNLVEAGGYLFFPYYKLTAEGNITNSARYILKKPLSGGTWTSILVETGSTYINEGTIEHLGGNYLIYIARNESTKEWTLYRSSDLGETWSSLGDLTFGEVIGTAGPARLSKFYINGTLVIACYHPDRANDDLKVTYGLASDIISSGVSGFNTATKTTIINNGTDDTFPHYGSVVHYDNNMNAFASYATEAGAANLAEKCYLDIFHVATSHYNTIKTVLGL